MAALTVAGASMLSNGSADADWLTLVGRARDLPFHTTYRNTGGERRTRADGPRRGTLGRTVGTGSACESERDADG